MFVVSYIKRSRLSRKKKKRRLVTFSSSPKEDAKSFKKLSEAKERIGFFLWPRYTFSER